MATVALFCALVLSAPGAADSSQSIVVLDMVSPEETRELATILSEVVLSEVRDLRPGSSVIGQSELKAMLAVEQQKMALGCENDTSCLAEIGGALGADLLLTGRLGKVGTIYILNLKLIDSGGARVVGHASQRVRGSEEQLIQTLVTMTHQLFGDSDYVAPGAAATAKKASPAPRAPAATASTSESGAMTPPGVEAQADDDGAWYTQWWVWTIAVAVVAGGTAAYFLTRDNGNNDDSEPVGGSMSVDLSQL